jgi:hypothetical protein
MEQRTPVEPVDSRRATPYIFRVTVEAPALPACQQLGSHLRRGPSKHQGSRGTLDRRDTRLLDNPGDQLAIFAPLDRRSERDSHAESRQDAKFAKNYYPAIKPVERVFSLRFFGEQPRDGELEAVGHGTCVPHALARRLRPNNQRRYCLGPPPLPPPPRAGAGGSVPPSARIFMFSSAVVNCADFCVLSLSRASSSASIELSYTSV